MVSVVHSVAAQSDLEQSLQTLCAGLSADEEARLVSVIRAADLPVEGPAWSASRYLSLMETDKKAERGAPRFVVLDGLGRARMQAVDESLVVAAIEAHRESSAPAPAAGIASA